MHKLIPILAVALCATAAMPSADALAHFVKWKAVGVAVGAGPAYQIEVQWNGGFWCSSSWTVTLRDAVGAVVQQRTFAGFENLQIGPGGNFYQENFVVTGGSSDPSVAFTANGYQLILIQNMPHYVINVVRGTYQGLTWVAVTPASPWAFGC